MKEPDLGIAEEDVGLPWAVRAIAMAALTALLSSCTATQVNVAPEVGSPGFLLGFWHGLIAPLAFIVSVFSDTVRIYAVPNTGVWYDLGYVLGVGGFSGGILARSRGQESKVGMRKTD